MPKINTEANNSVVVHTVRSSAKANSRSINSISRQMSKNQLINGVGSGNTSVNRNSGSQVVFPNSVLKNPNGQQPSSSVTTQSQKHLPLAI